MECKICDIQYIGKSEWSFHIRLNNYRHRISSTKAENLLPCERHFKLANHNFATDAKFTIIEKIEKTSNINVKKILEKRENFCISNLQL